MKWATIAGAALLVVLLARMARAGADPFAAGNWEYLPGYVPGSGQWL